MCRRCVDCSRRTVSTAQLLIAVARYGDDVVTVFASASSDDDS